MYNSVFGCALMYEIKRQLYIPAGINKVLLLCYVIFFVFFIPTWLEDKLGTVSNAQSSELTVMKQFTSCFWFLVFLLSFWWWYSYFDILVFICVITTQLQNKVITVKYLDTTWFIHYSISAVDKLITINVITAWRLWWWCCYLHIIFFMGSE